MFFAFAESSSILLQWKEYQRIIFALNEKQCSARVVSDLNSLKITEQKNQVTRSEQSNDYRVVVFGAGGVGKSSLVLRFIKGTFRESYIPTIEDTYRQVISCNKNICTLQITDTTGSHQFPAMQRLSITKGHAFILVYSVCSKQSLEELKPIWTLIKELKGEDIPNIPVMLVGNKCDETAELREVTEIEGKAQATTWNISFMETSAKTNHNELLNMEKTRTVSLQLDTKKQKKQKKEKKAKENSNGAIPENGEGGATSNSGGAKEKCLLIIFLSELKCSLTPVTAKDFKYLHDDLK
uniref:GTP-binding protein Di-Ras2 n=1 Tax=Glossina palpalis gambiensis TaxID=67801 RepID=A0A1B0BK03_9MUSC